MKVRTVTEKSEMAKIITDNHTWAPEEDDLYEQHAYGSATYDFTLFNQPVEDYSLYSKEERSEPPSSTLLDDLEKTGSILPMRPAHDTSFAQEATGTSPDPQSSTSASLPSLSPDSSVLDYEPYDENWDLIVEIQRQMLGQNSTGAPSPEGSPEQNRGTL